MAQRFWELDAARGLAVVLMVLFNWSFTFSYFGIYTLDAGWLYWWLFPRMVAGAFIFIAGVSFSVSYSKVKGKDTHEIRRKYLLRGGKIFFLGLLITLATYFLVAEGTIVFGILHLIGVSVVLALLFRNWNKTKLAISGLILILLGAYLNTYVFADNPWLLWIGVQPLQFYTFDYFPLLPWFGLFLIGMTAGKKLYPEGARGFRIRDRRPILVNFLGRHSLAVYLLHQPLLVAVLYLFGYTLF